MAMTIISRTMFSERIQDETQNNYGFIASTWAE
jgi:hypothetical protein